MISQRLSIEADAAAARYGQLIAAWQGLYSGALSAGNFGWAGQGRAIAADAYAVANTYLETEKDHIARLIDEIATEARRHVLQKLASNDTVDLADAALTHLSEAQSFISDEIVAQIHRDVAHLRQSLQRTTLEVTASARARGVPERRALIEHRLANTSEIDFVFRDRRNRRTPSTLFIRSLWRQSLLSVYNETVMLTLADHGIDRAAVVKRESGSVKQIGVVSLTGEAGTMSYADALATYFHPNSEAWLDVEDLNV